LRRPEYRTAAALLGTLDKGLKLAGLDYADAWRPTMIPMSGQHTREEVDAMMQAMDTARKQGKIRFCGASTHDGRISNGCSRLTRRSFICRDAVQRQEQGPPQRDPLRHTHGIGRGCLGIKPFSDNTLFKGSGRLDDPNAAEDDRLARMAIRYIWLPIR